MSKKLYGLVSGLIGVAATTANILLAFFSACNVRRYHGGRRNRS